LVRTLLFVVLLVTMVLIAVVLLSGKGGELLDSVTKILRFGR
jgi:preprotein translocase subunit SecG